MTQCVSPYGRTTEYREWPVVWECFDQPDEIHANPGWQWRIVQLAATNIVGHPAGPTVNPYTPKCVNPPAASDWHYGRVWRGKSVNASCTGA